MSAVAATEPRPTPPAPAETAVPSPAGPVDADRPVRLPPARPEPRFLQTIRFVMRPLGTSLRSYRELGDVWRVKLLSRSESFVITCHPDHVESLFKAKPVDAETLTSESPLRPILGPNSILTTIGDRHMRERKMLLPPFHGEAVQGYVEQIKEIAEREIDSWPVGKPFALAPRTQAVTLDVIMGGIFGVEGTPAPGTHEYRMRETFRKLLRMTTRPADQPPYMMARQGRPARDGDGRPRPQQRGGTHRCGAFEQRAAGQLRRLPHWLFTLAESRPRQASAAAPGRLPSV